MGPRGGPALFLQMEKNSLWEQVAASVACNELRACKPRQIFFGSLESAQMPLQFLDS
jgi:hypothetical protein